MTFPLADVSRLDISAKKSRKRLKRNGGFGIMVSADGGERFPDGARPTRTKIGDKDMAKKQVAGIYDPRDRRVNVICEGDIIDSICCCDGCSGGGSTLTVIRDGHADVLSWDENGLHVETSMCI